MSRIIEAKPSDPSHSQFPVFSSLGPRVFEQSGVVKLQPLHLVLSFRKVGRCFFLADWSAKTRLPVDDLTHEQDAKNGIKRFSLDLSERAPSQMAGQRFRYQIRYIVSPAE
jgi:hypothetical protein